ncbi:class C sortase [Cutibacterium porci]|nr:class C sortase [Cutibacterium porci]
MTRRRDCQGSGSARRRRSLLWIVVGIMILLLPVPLTLWNDYRVHQIAEQYSQQAGNGVNSEQNAKLLREAHAYNEKLAHTGHHALPPEPSTPGFNDYMKTLVMPGSDGAIGRVTVPSAGIDLPVYHTTTSDVLYRGAGHMFGSDLPVGGAGTTSVISAHTGMVNASMFDRLPTLGRGDDVYVTVAGQTLRYKVRDRRIVGPYDYKAITYERGVDKLVLITCTPYGINTDRLLVEAVRVPGTVASPPDGWHLSLSWWMILDLLLIAAIVCYLLMSRRRRKKKEQEPPVVSAVR